MSTDIKNEKQRKAENRKIKNLKEVYRLMQNGEVFEDFYSLFGSVQTANILDRSKIKSIDNITIDRCISIALQPGVFQKHTDINTDFLKFLSYSKEKIEAFNRRVKMAQKEMSRAMNLINPKERVSLLVVSWFIAPDGSPLKPLIMRKILQNFFQIKPGGKTAGSLKKEKENNAKQ